MGFGTVLYDEFKKKIPPKMPKNKEEELFTTLANAFSATLYHRGKADIIHGRSHLISFAYPGKDIQFLPKKAILSCEAADILFILYSDTYDQMRICYLQNKIGVSESCVEHCNMVQLSLLHDRPDIVVSKKMPDCIFNNPCIISKAITPSVGAYGIFYEAAKGVFDMSFWSADNIIPDRIKGLGDRKAVSKGSFGCKSISGYDYTNGCKTIVEFGDAINDMKIGTPICPKTPTWKEVFVFLHKYSASFRESLFYKNKKNMINDWTENEKYQGDMDRDVKGLPRFVVMLDVDSI